MAPRSKIAQMPQALRQWLHEALVDRAFGDIVDLTQELNDKLKEAGIAVYVGKSAVGAESQKLRRAQEAMRATTEAAKLLADTNGDDANKRGEAIMGLVEADMFETMLNIREAGDTEDPMERALALSTVGRNLATLSRARVNQARHRIELEAKAKDVAQAVAHIAASGGLSHAQVDEIRTRILGIASPAPAPAAA